MTGPVAGLTVGAVEYFVSTDSVSAAVIDADGACRFETLCRVEDCMLEAHRLLDALDGPSTPMERDRMLHGFVSGWGRKLLPAAENLAKFDVLVLIPHHTLHALPLHAVWSGADHAPLVATHAVTYCPSATSFRRCVDRNAARDTDCAAWIPGDDNRSPAGGPPTPRLCAGVAVDALDGQDEAYQAIGRLFASRFDEAYGPDLPRLNIKRPVGKQGDEPTTYDVVYFVCHGYVDRTRPVHSGLVVANPLAGQFERGIQLPGGKTYFFRDLPFRELPREIVPRPDCNAEMMTIGELQVEGFTGAQLVALLGCSTGSGHVLSGDMIESIADQWLRLGAASVLAGLWRLDVQFVSKWLPLFLENWLTRRQPKAIAFRNALVSRWREPDPPSDYRWAGLQLLGDWL